MTKEIGLACIVAFPDGIDLLVRAHAGSKRTGVLGTVGEFLKVGVSEPPEDGRANEALVEWIAKILDVRRSKVSRLTGKSANKKRFRIEGIAPLAALATIQGALAEK